MKKAAFLFVLLLSVMLSACSMQTPTVEGGEKEEANRLLEQMEKEAQAVEQQRAEQQRQETLRQSLTQAKQRETLLRDEKRQEAEEETRRKAEEETRRKAEEEKRREAEAEKRRKAEEEKRREAEKETRRKAEEEQKAEEERKAKLAAQGIIEGEHGILMGSFSTSFADSGEARKHNIRHAAKMINGTKLAPGEGFSTASAIGPITEENGYQTAGAYQDGKVIDSVGGGVCQISTTLYNAVLSAELNVTERAEHSMTVSYVDVARDAAIAGDYKDLCFVNDTDGSVYIEGWASDSEVCFQLWGADTKKKNGRTIAFETVILEEYSPGEPEITEDDSKESDYYHETQAAHKGYKAELFKLVYQDGVETERVKINSSSYEASPAHAVVGTQN